MATIRLKDRRSGTVFNYPLAFFDFDAWTYYGGTETEGSIITANTGLPSSVIGSQDKFYVCSVSDAYKYLSNTVLPARAGNLLYFPPNTKWIDVFAPTLDQSPTTYSTPPAGYNVLGDIWRSSGSPIDGIEQVTQAPASFDITKTYYSSEVTTHVFETVNGGFFGVSGFVGNGYMQNLAQIVLVGGKQYDRGETFASNQRNNISWSPSMDDIILDNDAGDYRTTGTRIEISDYSTAKCPDEFISTQCIYTTRNGQDLCGVASIEWEFNAVGDLRPKSFTINFLPLWFWGGIAGEFDPEIPEVDDIPANTTTISDGTWRIIQSAAGSASIPSVSPLAGIGTTDPGMHIIIADQKAIKKISDRAWSTISSAQLESFTSGLISCGFLPYEFIKNIMVPANGVTDVSIGRVNVNVPNDGSYHLWNANSSIFVQILAATFSLSLKEVSANYLDFEPFTSVSLEIPFCGEIAIPASSCIGGNIEVIMNCNITTGDIVATVNCTSSDNILAGTYTPTTPLKKTFFAYGNCFSSMPIVGTNSGISQFLSGAMQTISGLGTLATGNPAGFKALTSGSMAMSESVMQPVTGGSPIGSPALIGNKKVILKIRRPSPNYTLENLGYQPYTLEKKAKLVNLKQTENPDFHINGKDFVVVREMALPDAGLTSSEKDMINQLLQGGVFI